MRKLSFRPSAWREILEAGDFYDVSSPGRGALFAASVERAIEEISTNPTRYALYEGRRMRQEYRRYLIPGYPYFVAYAVDDEEIVIVAVAHTSRAPGYWERR